MGKVILKGNLDYVAGHLRYGHYEVVVDELFVKNSTQEQLKQHLKQCGNLIVDDYEIEDHGDIKNLEIEPVK